MSAYADDVTIIVSTRSHTELIGMTLKEYEVVTGARINTEMLAGMQLGTWRSKSMLSNSIVGGTGQMAH